MYTYILYINICNENFENFRNKSNDYKLCEDRYSERLGPKKKKNIIIFLRLVPIYLGLNE